MRSQTYSRLAVVFRPKAKSVRELVGAWWIWWSEGLARAPVLPEDLQVSLPGDRQQDSRGDLHLILRPQVKVE